MFANSALLEDGNGNTEIYRWEIASIAPLVPLLAFITALFVPESPVYLVGLLFYSFSTLGRISKLKDGHALQNSNIDD